ncbi:MAG: Glycerol-1-phosphate dehydrogenase (NAD(P)+) [Methanomassiliicoccales archaeon PtaB.Bin134]|jgi:glycerol dehydrogenase|nr:MAG: Glycerol-1-phosphate dehydrogenase (NAD(P)+) [Methanomassiliicoccales archaeon PtaB.Bin134]
MFKKAIFPGRYIQGKGAVEELPSLVAALGGHGLLLASPSVIEKVFPEFHLHPEENGIRVERFNGECCEKELDRLAGIIAAGGSKVIIGMGGGKTIDTAKIAADRANLPAVVVPTIASTDAPTSGCAVIYTKEGRFSKVVFQRSNPAAVLVDTSIIAKAPTRFLVAGMGDALATWFEARSCHRTGSPNECGGLSTEAGLQLARLCYDTLLADGVEARLACDDGDVTPALERIVEANILLSGLGFESGGLASAHSVHNGLTALQETHGHYHGEKVAFGVLVGLHLTGAASKEMREVYSFCEAVGLPTSLRDIGLGSASRERLGIAAEAACAQDQPIHHEEGEITPENVLEAMLRADAMGRDRKGRSV